MVGLNKMFMICRTNNIHQQKWQDTFKSYSCRAGEIDSFHGTEIDFLTAPPLKWETLYLACLSLQWRTLLFFSGSGKLVIQTISQMQSSFFSTLTAVYLISNPSELFSDTRICAQHQSSPETNSHPLLPWRWVLPPDQVQLAVPGKRWNEKCLKNK